VDSIEAFYAGFVSSLPERLRSVARDLPRFLARSAAAAPTWAHVFGHPVTLVTPKLVAQALPHAEPDKVRGAAIGHALAAIEALGRDRIATRQLRESPELAALLAELRRARDAVLEGVWTGATELTRAADRETDEAIKEQNALLRRLSAVSFDDYRRISLAKQAPVFPACIGLAHVSGASPTQIEALRRALVGIALGRQFETDAGEWEDDWRRGGGAWAVSLARRKLEAVKDQSADERPTEPDLVRRRVHRTRVLYSMLRAARHQYRSAWRYARMLGSDPLVRWTEQRLAHLDGLLPLEARHAGYVVRAIKLAPWASEVLT
jgi:hypothetical protein